MKKLVSLVIAMMVFLPYATYSFAGYPFYPYEDYEEILFNIEPDFEQGVTAGEPRQDYSLFDSIILPNLQLYDSIDPQKWVSKMGRVESIEYNNLDNKYKEIQWYDMDGKLTKYDEVYGDEIYSNIVLYEYNEDLLINKVIKSIDQNGNVYESREYPNTYDDSNRLIERVRYTMGCDYYVEQYIWGDNGCLNKYAACYYINDYPEENNVYVSDYIANYRYDSTGNLIEVIWNNGDVIKYKYDDNNRIIRVDYELNRGELVSAYEVVKYDNKGRVAEYEYALPAGEVGKRCYKYNDLDQLVEWVQEDNVGKNKAINKTEYTYNSESQMVLELTETKNSVEGDGRSVKEYEYDNNGLLKSKVSKSGYSDSSGSNSNWETIYNTSYEYNNGRLEKVVLLVDGEQFKTVEYNYYDEVDIDLNITAAKGVKYEVYEPDASSDETVQLFVTSQDSCAVAAILDDGSYKLLPSNRTVDPDVHSFTIDTEKYKDCTIAIAKRGDLNLDGKIAVNDVTMAKAASLSKLDLAPEAKLAADMNGDGVVRANEVAMLRAAALKKAVLSW